MIENGKVISDRVKAFAQLKAELKEAFNETITLREKVKLALDASEEGTPENYELENMLLSLNVQVKEFDEEIRSLTQIEVVTHGISKKITESTPANKDRLLRKILSFSTIAEANKQLNEFKELRDIANSLVDAVQDRTLDTVENILDNDQASQKELKAMHEREARRTKRTLEIENKIAQGRKNVQLALKANTGNVDQMILEYKEGEN